MRRSRRHTRSEGFTLIELLIVVAILSILGAMVLETWRTWVPRFELRQATNMVAQCIQKARLEALQRGVKTVVQGNFENRTLIAFADVQDDFAGGTSLVFDETAGVGTRRNDYQVCRVALPGVSVNGSQFGGPAGGTGGGDSVTGFTVLSPTSLPSASASSSGAAASSSPGSSSPPSGDSGGDSGDSGADTTYEHDGNVLVFEPNGATRSPGAFRLTDASNANHFEIAVTSISGNVEIRKWLLAPDSPTDTPGFFPEGNLTFSEDSVGKNVWAWYDKTWSVTFEGQ